MTWLNSKKKQTLRLLKFIGRRSAGWMILGVCGTLVLAIVELSIAYFIPFFLKALGLIDAGLVSDSFIYQYEIPAWIIAPVLITLGIIRFVGQYLVNQSGIAAQEGISARLRKILIYRILLHPNQSLIAASQSNYYLGTIFPLAATAVCLLTISIAQGLHAISLIFMMIMVSWKEALIGVFGLIFVGLVVRQIAKLIRIKAAQVPIENRKLINGFERVARNWLLVKVLRTQKYEHYKFSNSITSVFNHSVKSASLSNLASSGTPLLGIFLLTIIVFISNTYWSTPGSVLLSFLYIFIRFIQGLAATVNSITQANQFFPQFQEAIRFSSNLSDDHVTEALKATPLKYEMETISDDAADSQQAIAPSIALKHVSFAYDNRDILKNISWSIAGGKTLGIVGPSGSGKSTLLLIILGALKPDKGSVQVGKDELKPVLLDDQLNIGYVGPEPFLFEGSIRDNLAYGLQDIADEVLWKALSDARLFDEVHAISGQLEHRISENGDGLSAGQKQRLCLARIFLRKPSLIVLDEATANLDSKTENDVIDSLAKVKKRATVVIVTHRLSTLKHADYVFDLERNELKALLKDACA